MTLARKLTLGIFSGLLLGFVVRIARSPQEAAAIALMLASLMILVYVGTIDAKGRTSSKRPPSKT